MLKILDHMKVDILGAVDRALSRDFSMPSGPDPVDSRMRRRALKEHFATYVVREKGCN
jgi:hypothetical protein